MDINEFKSLLVKTSSRVSGYEILVSTMEVNKPVQVVVPEGKTITGGKLGITRAAKKMNKKVVTAVDSDGNLFACWMSE